MVYGVEPTGTEMPADGNLATLREAARTLALDLLHQGGVYRSSFIAFGGFAVRKWLKIDSTPAGALAYQARADYLASTKRHKHAEFVPRRIKT